MRYFTTRICLPVSFNLRAASFLTLRQKHTKLVFFQNSPNAALPPVQELFKTLSNPYIYISIWQKHSSWMAYFYLISFFVALFSYFLQPLRLSLCCFYVPNCIAMAACTFATTALQLVGNNRQMILSNRRHRLSIPQGMGELH